MNVSDANILFYDHLSADNLVAVRGEFTITVKRFVNPQDVKNLLQPESIGLGGGGPAPIEPNGGGGIPIGPIGGE